MGKRKIEVGKVYLAQHVDNPGIHYLFKIVHERTTLTKWTGCRFEQQYLGVKLGVEPEGDDSQAWYFDEEGVSLDRIFRVYRISRTKETE